MPEELEQKHEKRFQKDEERVAEQAAKDDSSCKDSLAFGAASR
jgi:hypothetical protein